MSYSILLGLFFLFSFHPVIGAFVDIFRSIKDYNRTPYLSEKIAYYGVIRNSFIGLAIWIAVLKFVFF